jgi:hypothetical protein
MRKINGKRDCERVRRMKEGLREIEKEKKVYRSVW